MGEAPDVPPIDMDHDARAKALADLDEEEIAAKRKIAKLAAELAEANLERSVIEEKQRAILGTTAYIKRMLHRFGCVPVTLDNGQPGYRIPEDVHYSMDRQVHHD